MPTGHLNSENYGQLGPCPSVDGESASTDAVSGVGSQPLNHRLSKTRWLPSLRGSPSIIDAFRPHPLLLSGHLQTIYGGLVSGVLPGYSAAQRLVSLRDGEALVVHEEQPANGRPHVPDAPIAVLVHGLGGDHTSPYMRRLAHRLTARGVRAWRIDLRGCGAGLPHAFRPAHAGSSTDLAAVVAYAQREFPGAEISIAAYSLGGNILLKMLGELAEGSCSLEVDPARITRALAVAPPADLHGCCANMERWSRMPYTRYYLKLLARQVQLRSGQWDAWRSIQPSRPPRTIREFDHWYTAPLAGFSNTSEYYTSSSSAQWLSKISVPTRLLLDEHDPIIPIDAFRPLEFGPEITVEVTRFGGHLGYLALGPGGRMRRWMDDWSVAAICGTP